MVSTDRARGTGGSTIETGLPIGACAPRYSSTVPREVITTVPLPASRAVGAEARGRLGRELTVIDLFSGAGGLSAGLHQASSRFRVVRAVEQDVAAAATYAQNFGDVTYAGTVERWLRDETGVSADLVVGGPPCQGFSTIGNRDPLDERNSLWRDFVETVRRVRPRAFVMENVPSFLKSHEYVAFMESFADGDLSSYELSASVLDAADHGAAQHRRRAIVLGFHRDVAHPGAIVPSNRPRRTVRDAFEGIRPFVGSTDLRPGRVRVDRSWLPGAFRSDELHFTREWSELDQERFRAVPYGGSRIHLPEQLSMRCWLDSPRSASDVMGRLVWERPSVTIRTEFFRPEKGRFLHPTQHRAITHWEAARLQGFEDSFLWVGGRADIARQIGNAVPVPLAAAVGRHVAGALE